MIKLLVGLGNPGREYERTRHNLGWVVVNALAAKYGLAWRHSPQFEAEIARWDVPGAGTRWLLRPTTFMNASGRSVGGFARFHRIDPGACVAVYDDLTIDLGLVKVSVSGSAGGHNGVASLLECLGPGFVRYRLGIGPKTPQQMELADFVLGKFNSDQEITLSQKLDHHVQGLELLLSRGADQAMNQLNRREPS